MENEENQNEAEQESPEATGGESVPDTTKGE